MKTSFRCF